jgi:hypothetical protein
MMREGIGRSSTKPDLKRLQQTAPRRRAARVVSVSLFDDERTWLDLKAGLLQKATSNPQMKSALVRAAIQLLKLRLTASNPDDLFKQFKELQPAE